jgi:hypothetical protein
MLTGDARVISCSFSLRRHSGCSHLSRTQNVSHPLSLTPREQDARTHPLPLLEPSR